MGRGPSDADITIVATVHAGQLRFDEVPRTSTIFTGIPGHEAASGSDRTNLPERVEEDVTYREAQVDYWLNAALRYTAEDAEQAVRRMGFTPLPAQSRRRSRRFRGHSR